MLAISDRTPKYEGIKRFRQEITEYIYHRVTTTIWPHLTNTLDILSDIFCLCSSQPIYKSNTSISYYFLIKICILTKTLHLISITYINILNKYRQEKLNSTNKCNRFTYVDIGGVVLLEPFWAWHGIKQYINYPHVGFCQMTHGIF